MPYNPESEYTVIITDNGIACKRREHPRRPREAIAWDEVNEILVVTTNEGAFAIDVWVLFAGESSGRSIPQGVNGFDALFEVFRKFPGFEYEAFINAMSSTEDARFVCWRKR